MSTTRTQKPKSKTQTTNPPLRYSTPAPNRPTVSNTPTPQPHYINAIHEHDQRSLIAICRIGVGAPIRPVLTLKSPSECIEL